jgi:hypothetical protein
MSRKFCSWVLFMALVISQSVMAAQPIDFSAYRHKMPADLAKEVTLDKSIRLIVRYYDAAIDTEIQNLERSSQQDKQSKSNVLAFKAQRFRSLKDRAITKMDRTRFKVQHDYSHLPMNVATVKGEAGLLGLLADPTVAEVFRDEKLHHFLAESAPLIRSTNVVGQTGYKGVNTMAVVLDTGV